MSQETEILKKAGDELVRRIRKAYDDKGITDTGGAKDSLSSHVDRQTIVVEGVARILFNEFGRRPGTPPPYDVIRDWVERKLNVPSDQIDSVSWAIVKKIADKGTDVLTDRAKGLGIEIILADLLDELSEIYYTFKAESIIDGLVKKWQ